jgi:hypothetical protein
MTTAIIGVETSEALERHLVRGGERVVLAVGGSRKQPPV